MGGIKHISAAQMQEIDQRAQEEFNIPGLFLMENAGKKTTEVAIKSLKTYKLKRAFVFCGPGNNGGDGFVIARHLINNGVTTKILLLVDAHKIRGDALANFTLLQAMQADIIDIKKDFRENSNLVIEDTDLIVDAIFGIGLVREVSGLYKEVIDWINKSKLIVLAVDVPSGLCATTGMILGIGVKAKYTVTFGIAKSGFFLNNGPAYIGELTVADIGFPRELFNKI